jgi:Ca2+-transporting ATPase
MNHWFTLEASEVIKSLSSHSERGLTEIEGRQRITQYGYNQLHAGKKISLWRILGEQFTDFMVLVLMGAALVSFFLGEKADAVTIIAIIALNAVLGFIQEYRAEKSLAALKELTAPTAHVCRDGKLQQIAATLVVPGDILILESGDRVAADARIIEAYNLEINEATLTGESLAVAKDKAVIGGNRLALGDQHNMVFAGTVATSGRGKAVVVATGMKTEIGKIAELIDNAPDEATPLQKRLEQLGRYLILICLAICAAVGTLGFLRGEEPRQMFLAAVSLAVAAIPEGLPAIVTISLAIGVQKMIQRRAIIRKLPAVETLGCATIICSDKTGTLTQNKLAVTRLWVPEAEYPVVSSTPKVLSPEIVSKKTAWGKNIEHSIEGPQVNNQLRKLLETGVLCNNAELEPNSQTITGDPTEGALLIVAHQFGIYASKLQSRQYRLDEIPFSSERKRMGVWVKNPIHTPDEAPYSLLVKGAADVIVGRCDRILTAAGIIPITRHWRTVIEAKVEQWGADALRVLAFAYRDSRMAETDSKNQNDPETGLIFIGLTGMIDPPRPESRTAIERSRRAGIQTKMITGDYPRTAAAVAKQIGLLRPGGKIISGAEMDTLTDESLAAVIGEIDVFARVSPHHKLRVVRALKKNGAVVAMTGDGVNDAPAVKEADIGVAMGLSGTDVTKEASAMVIADDNYAAIVAAVEEGRIIYENIRKFIRYLLSCNIGEILTIFGGTLMGLPFPLLPIQILWVNLVTDGLPAIALGMEPAEPGIMHRPPRPPREGIFSRGLGLRIVVQGIIIGGTTLLFYLYQLKNGASLEQARTAAFAALVFAQLFFVFQCRSEQRSMFQLNPLENKYLMGAVLISGTMQIAVMTVPWLQTIFYTTALSGLDWLAIILGTGISTFFGNIIIQFRSEIRKHLSFFRLKPHRPDA